MLVHHCQSIQSSPPVAPLHSWKWPTRPWARLHIDFAGPFPNKTFLIVVDSFHMGGANGGVCSPSSAVAKKAKNLVWLVSELCQIMEQVLQVVNSETW